jgi:hypothetical protein
VVLIQEDIENRSIALSIRAAKVTEQVLVKAVAAALRKMEQSRNRPKEGKQSIKSLSKGGTLSSVEVTEGNIKGFDPIARKYGISYALQKDASEDPPRWIVFFKAKDADAMTAAFKEFSAKAVKLENDRPSVRETMRNFREALKNVVKDKIKVKHREGPEL